LTPKNQANLAFAARLAQAMTAKSIKHSPTVLANLFNVEFDGNGVGAHTARNWLLGNSFPTQEKMICLAKLLDTSAAHLRYGRTSEKTLMVENADGGEIELTSTQQQLVRKYIILSTSQQKLVNDLIDEIAG
jgi:hypothetical protein